MDSRSEREHQPGWVVGEPVDIPPDVDTRWEDELFVVNDVMFPGPYYRARGFTSIAVERQAIWVREETRSRAPGYTLVSSGWRIDVEVNFDRTGTIVRAERRRSDTCFESWSLGRFDRIINLDEILTLAERFLERH